jgi:hypothetical protein
MEMRRRTSAAVALVAALLLARAGGAPAAGDGDLEMKVKAAFLFNFAKFATWPPSKMGDPDATLHLCVEGTDAFARVLEDTVRGRNVGTHAVDVLTSPRGADLKRCHIVYVAPADDSRVAAELAAVANDAVLTVHESPETQPLGVIRFFLSDDGRVRFEVNVAAASRAQLALSSKLLEVSQVVSR